MLSDDEKRELLRDGLNTNRRDHFRKAGSESKALTFEQYLEWLADMERWSPAPPPTGIKRYKKVLI